MRGVWQQVLALALLAGLLGGVALGAVAGARRTNAAYERYLTAINASDVGVNVPGQLPGMAATRPYELISSLPGVIAHAAYIGLSGVPLVHGKPDNSFLVNSLNGSLDGEYFSQDRATVLAGRLPPQGSATLDGSPGGTYELQHARASAIVNTEQMGGQPLTLALGLAAAAVLSLALTVFSLVRRRRRELALLKALGMTRSQVRAVIAWQTTLTLLIAVAVGGALGIAGGRLAWHAFAGSLGVAPIVEVPVAALILGLVALVLAGNLLASLPAAVAARTRPGVSLRTE